jgi:hypothetical protein
MRKKDATLGIIHFDEVFHRFPGEKNIFDHMKDCLSLRRVPRERLVRDFGEIIARAHRALLIKAEIQLLTGVHAIIPSELIPYRTLILTAANAGTINEREKLVTEIEIDLNNVTVARLARLTKDEIWELRNAGSDYFNALKEGTTKTGFSPELNEALVRYTEKINSSLYKVTPSLPEPSAPRRIGPTSIQVFQWNVSRPLALGGDGVASMFKIIADVGLALYLIPRGLMDISVQRALSAQSASMEEPLAALIDPGIKARLARTDEAQLLQIENPTP